MLENKQKLHDQSYYYNIKIDTINTQQKRQITPPDRKDTGSYLGIHFDCGSPEINENSQELELNFSLSRNWNWKGITRNWN